jgi:hypothetical protein
MVRPVSDARGAFFVGADLRALTSTALISLP